MYENGIKRVILISVCLVSLFGTISASMALPIFPALFLDKASGLILDNTIDRKLMYSLCIACFPLAMFTATPILGALSDILQQYKTRLVLYGIICIMLSDILSFVAISLHNVWLFLFSRLICGFCVAEFPVSMSLLNDVSNSAMERKSNLKLLTVSLSIGSICGPLITLSILYLTKVNLSINVFLLIFAIAIIFDIFSVVVFYYCTKTCKQLEQISVAQQKVTLRNMLNSILFMLRHPTAKILVFTFILYSFGSGLLIQGIPLYLASDLNYNSEKISFYTIAMAMATIIGMYILEPCVVHYFKNFRIILKASLLILTIIFISIYVLRSLDMQLHVYKIGKNFPEYHLLMFALLLYLVMSLLRISFNELFASSVEPEKQSSAIATMSQWIDITGTISGIMIGFLIEHKSLILLAGISLGISYLLLVRYRGSV